MASGSSADHSDLHSYSYSMAPSHQHTQVADMTPSIHMALNGDMVQGFDRHSIYGKSTETLADVGTWT